MLDKLIDLPLLELYDLEIKKNLRYTLPIASATTLGGVKIGKNIAIDQNGVISGNYGNASASANGLMAADDKTKLDATNIAYGTCTTPAATVEKAIAITGNTKWTLKPGSIIVAKFTYTNTAQNPKINVNSTGAKSVVYNTAVITTGSLSAVGTAGRYTTFIYDGTNYVWIGQSIDNNTTYSNATLGQGYGTCASAADATATVVTLASYALVVGGVVSVKFTNAVPAAATMNINNRGAKAIFYRGVAITANVIKASDIATFIYDGTRYHLISIDRGLAPTGVKAGNYGPTATATLNFGGTVNVPYLSVDADGRVLNATHYAIKLPAAPTTVAGNAGSATKLQTPRNINGTAFDGTKDIVTAKWGTARKINGSSVDGSVDITTANWGAGRTIKIGNNGKTVNGSANYTWTLAEIGALPTAGGTMTGAIASSLTTTTHLKGNQGVAIINSTAGAGAYTMLAKMNSKSGYFTEGVWTDTYNVFYTVKSAVDEGTNNFTKRLVLLNEAGNSTFPGTVVAAGFSGPLTGNASTATKLLTKRQINGTDFDGSVAITTAKWGNTRKISITGDVTGSISLDGSKDVSFGVLRKGCQVGQSGNTVTNPWYRFASANITAVNLDSNIIFNVYCGFGDQITYLGVLAAHVRSGSTVGSFSLAELKWLVCGSGIAEGNFVLAYKTSTTALAVELWTNISVTYRILKFDVISEGSRTARANNLWTLYNTVGAGSAAAVTSGYTTIKSAIVTLKNPTTANAGSATKLATARNINGTAFDGTKEITTAKWGTARSINGTSIDGSKDITTVKWGAARTINGTSIDGSKNITTTQWGAARNITIGNTLRSVNGSGNYTWTLADLGALPTAGGTMTGTINRAIGGSYIDSWNNTPIRNTNVIQNDGAAYNPICGVQAATGRWVIGAIYDQLEFTYYKNSRTSNGTDRTVTLDSNGRTSAIAAGLTDAINSGYTISISWSGQITTSNYIAAWEDGTSRIRAISVGNLKTVLNVADKSHAHDTISWGNNSITTVQANDTCGLGSINNVNIKTWYGFSVSSSKNSTIAFSINARNGDVYIQGNTYANNWLRTYGQTGWYSQTYGGGWYMTDTSWIRAYGDKHIYTPGQMKAGSMACDGNMTVAGSLTVGGTKVLRGTLSGTTLTITL